MIFLNSLFGYLSVLIVIKWCTGSQADLYHVMIYMFLSPTDNLGENQLFWGQRPLQVWIWFFYSLLLNTTNSVSCFFFILNYFFWCADCVIAFGCNCSSMDALSKTFYTKEASYWGATFTCLVYGFLAWKFIILFSQTTLLDLCVHVLVVWVSSFWLWILHKVFKNQFFLRTIIRLIFFGMNML